MRTRWAWHFGVSNASHRQSNEAKANKTTLFLKVCVLRGPGGHQPQPGRMAREVETQVQWQKKTKRKDRSNIPPGPDRHQPQFPPGHAQGRTLFTFTFTFTCAEQEQAQSGAPGQQQQRTAGAAITCGNGKDRTR